MNDSGDNEPTDMTSSSAPAKALQKADAAPPARVARMSQVVEEWRAEIAARRRDDDLRHDSETRLRLALEATGMATWEWDIINDTLHYSPQLGPMLGLAAGATHPNCKAFGAIIYPEDQPRFEQAIARALEGPADYRLEFRVIWPDETVHWLASRGLIVRNEAGEPWRMIGVTMDITERKQAEQSRYQLLNRIVTAQEEERRRVSRELHDQMGQSLAALMVGLESLKVNFADAPPVLDRLRELQDMANGLSQKVHSLAWDLRPPALDDLGLHLALQRYVEHWSERSQIVVDWHTNGFTSRRLPSRVETTLYRVVQEALTNVLKHAQASRVSLIMRAAADSVSAIVEDNGRGFDAELTMHALDPHYKLGLVGMQERVLLVNGTLNIESVFGYGTTVYVRIPLNPQESGHEQRPGR